MFNVAPPAAFAGFRRAKKPHSSECDPATVRQSIHDSLEHDGERALLTYCNGNVLQDVETHRGLHQTRLVARQR